MIDVLSQVTVAIVNAEPAGQEQMDAPTALVLPSGQDAHDVDCGRLNVLDGQAARGNWAHREGGCEEACTSVSWSP